MAQNLNSMLTDGIKELDELKNLSNELAGKVTTSQLRKFFGSVKKIQADFGNQKGEIILLDPHLAYAVGRAKGDAKRGLEKLYRTLEPLINDIKEDQKKFNNLVSILEAVVAYHKANPNTKD